jgi:glycosyltransferase involved in cell wall biosynthesis
VISIIVVTHNRKELLRLCVENVLARTSSLTTEIIVWDNASTDGTRDYLESLEDPRICVVQHPENIAMNARARALRLATSDYLIELDDDIVGAPPRWDETLLNAYLRLPEIGRLAAYLEYDPNDAASRYLRYMRERRGAYPLSVMNGIRLFEGTPGGACTMTSHELYERLGGYREHKRYPYWRPEIPYEKKMRKLGLRSAYLADLEVRHAGGHRRVEDAPRPKVDYFLHETRRRLRKDRIKKVLLMLPFTARLNDRFRWFEPPAPPYDVASHEHDPREEPSRAPTTTS